LHKQQKTQRVLQELQKAVDEVNATVSNAEAIKKFEVIDSELSEKSGHLTPSLKIKREVCDPRFRSGDRANLWRFTDNI
jgi:long-subunit acyl-CoA synthetase (AMP-forming)